MLAGSPAAKELDPPAYRTPLLITVHDTQAPGLDCAAATIKGGDVVMVPLTLLASACAAWTADTCEIWVPRTGLAVLWSAASALMTPTTILGHEAMHCWLHEHHGLFPWS
jgi:fatty acid desaturase